MVPYTGLVFAAWLTFSLQPIGGRVIVVLGQWRGHEGRLEALDIASFSAQVTLDQGPLFKLNKYKGSSGEAFSFVFGCILPLRRFFC